MRKLILALIVLNLISGCNQGKKPQDSPKNEINANRSRKEIVRDSLYMNHPKKLFANFEVGMNEADFEKAVSIFNKKTKRKDEYGYDSNFIGDYKYLQIIPQFDNGKLYSIYFNPAPIGYEYYRTKLPDVYDSLVKDISKNYFSTSSKEIPSMISIEKGYSYTLAEWDLKNRVINISIEASGVNYSIPLFVYDKKIVDSLKNSMADSEKKIKDKSSSDL